MNENDNMKPKQKPSHAGGFVVDTPEGITAFQLLSLRGCLSMEARGMGRRGRSALSIIKQLTGLRGTKATMGPKYDAWLRERGFIEGKGLDQD